MNLADATIGQLLRRPRRRCLIRCFNPPRVPNT
jgi:hypothetical protein